MELSRVNSALDHCDAVFLESYVGFERVLTLKPEAAGGIWETFQLRLVFREVQVFHLSRVLHFAIGLRIAAEREAMAWIPPTSYDEQDSAAKCFVITNKGQDTGFYVYSDSVELQGVPDNVRT